MTRKQKERIYNIRLDEYRRMETGGQRLVQIVVGALMWLIIIVIGALFGVAIYLMFDAVRIVLTH